MRFFVIALSLLGVAGVAGTAVAQTSTVMINGRQATYSLTPPPAKGSASSDMLGDEKAAILEQVRKSKPMVATETGYRAAAQPRP